jgi:hypothetical protein
MAHQRDIAYPAKEFGKGPVASQIPIVKGSDPVTGCLFVKGSRYSLHAATLHESGPIVVWVSILWGQQFEAHYCTLGLVKPIIVNRQIAGEALHSRKVPPQYSMKLSNSNEIVRALTRESLRSFQKMLSLWLERAPVSNLEVMSWKSSILDGLSSLIRTRDLPSWN